MNCVSKTEGDGTNSVFSKFVSRLMVRQMGTVSRIVSMKSQFTLFVTHCVIQFFKPSWTIQQSIRNKRLLMERTKTPPQLLSFHFHGGKFPVIDLGHSVSSSTEIKERV